jgi:hypothetical protein
MTKAPLTNRLRAEADEWGNDEVTRGLLLEAAEALDRISAEINRLLAEKS